jgi:hypothetical protein
MKLGTQLLWRRAYGHNNEPSNGRVHIRNANRCTTHQLFRSDTQHTPTMVATRTDVQHTDRLYSRLPAPKPCIDAALPHSPSAKVHMAIISTLRAPHMCASLQADCNCETHACSTSLAKNPPIPQHGIPAPVLAAGSTHKPLRPSDMAATCAL